MKVCSLYGAGYYYIPGTDVCMKIGGYVRTEFSYGSGNDTTAGPFAADHGFNTRTNGVATANGQPTLSAADHVWRSRAYINFDARQQTAYGTLRTYLQIGINGNNNIGFSANRAFVQIAGFTVGLASSYFDHYSVAAIGYIVDSSSDTGDGGRQVFAYTAQLGNGVSASLSLEQAGQYRRSIASAHANAALGGTFGNAYGKIQMPDIVGNVRINQAWGSAQIMGALHQVTHGYYLNGGVNNGHADDRWGWAVGAGLRVNTPMVAPGDYLAFQVAYSQGALRYIFSSAPGNPVYINGNTSLGYGFTSDAVVGGIGTELELTTAWGIAGGYEHFWTPSLRTSIHGSYHAISYNATANNLICTAQLGAAGASQIQFANVAACNNDYQVWNIGSRTQWNVTRDFYMGFDVVYQKLQTASRGAVVTDGGFGAQAASTTRVIADQDVVHARVRWHRDVAP